MNGLLRSSGACLAAAIVLTAAAAGDELRVSTRSELIQALRAAGPGTTILLASGKYPGGLSHAGLRGSKEQAIVIAAADVSNPPVLEGGVHLSSPAHVELRDLVIAESPGNGLNIDDGGSSQTPAHDLVLRNLVVRDNGPRGNRDGIKLSGVERFRVENCVVERWGSDGSAIDMVGCHNGTIVNCQFREARGDGANGVQAKGGSRAIAIQRCRFENAGGRGVNIGGSTGLQFFRPRDAQYEAQDITVEDCEFIGGLAAVAFVGVDGALVQHNTIYRPRRWPIRILQETTDPRFVACRKGRFLNNVVVFRADEVREVINIGGSTAPETFEFTGNAWFSADRPAATQRLVRLPVRETKGTYGRDPQLQAPEQGDLRIGNSGLANAGVRRAESPVE